MLSMNAWVNKIQIDIFHKLICTIISTRENKVGKKLIIEMIEYYKDWYYYIGPIIICEYMSLVGAVYNNNNNDILL